MRTNILSLIAIAAVLIGGVFSHRFPSSRAEAATITYLIDFGRSTTPTTDEGWNNFTDPRVSASPVTLEDSTGATTSATLEITNRFWYDPGDTVDFATNINGTTDSTIYPDDATRDSFFLGTLGSVTDNSATIEFAGLNDSSSYDFTFYASRVAGDGVNRTAEYTIGATTVTLNATNNIDNTTEITGVTPTSGVITLDIDKAASATFAYLGVLEITETTSANQSPTADAGEDQSITLPTTTATISGSGSDNDGTIASYAWSFISGPSTPTIETDDQAETDLSDLDTAGTYVFRLTVTDDDGATDTDDVDVVVNAAANQSPTADAGIDQSITLPTGTVSLSGSGTDDDGTIASYAWTEVSSNDATIESPSSADTDVSDLAPGSYTFRLTVTDDDGATDTDDITVTVNDHIVGACPAKTIVILGSSTSAGYGVSPSSDAYASRFETYFEDLVDGNEVINLAVGGYTTYHIQATGTTPPGGRPSPVTTNNITEALSNGADAILVNMPSNDTANGYSESEQQTNFQALASVASNADVPIWFTTTQPRNLNQAGINLQIAVRDWIESTYGSNSIDFWSVVADGDGEVADEFDQGDGIHLNNAGHTKLFARVLASNLIDTICTNENPVADAGSDQVITLPTTTATLSGSGTDDDGTIESYAWSFISGPSTPTIDSASTASTDLSGLSSAGTYVFRLTVTDDRSGTDTDDVSVVVNTAPTADAGSDQNIQLPTTTATLSGSGSDNDGTIAAYAWSFISGPSTPTIDSAATASTDLSDLDAVGTYVFRLTVTDDDDATDTDDVSVTVAAANVSPTADAGEDQSITLPTSSVTLTGSGTDSDGTIASYAWAFESGPATPTIDTDDEAETDVTGLSSAGTYVFELTVTDNEGATDTDTVSVEVSPANVSPTADAGEDQSITLPTTTATISGSGSDNDGTIASYAWSFISGPSTPTIETDDQAETDLSDLDTAGTYVFRLTVTDDDGATDTDDVDVVVNAAANQSPTADAGEDQSITLPTTTATLSGSGSDNDGTIASYAWSFISGPSTPTIDSAATASTDLSDLDAVGTYVFRLTVTDDDDATDTDDVEVVVNAAANQSPVADAGTDQEIQLPTSSVTLTGSGTDSDGTVESYAWSFISGPSAPSISSASSAETDVVGLSFAGTYVFRLTVTDDDDATDTDDVSVTVAAANVSPTADAGEDQSITLPTSSVTLTGSGTDSDGTIASYAWAFESGPATPTIDTDDEAETDVTGLSSAGTYVFELTVTDNEGATDTDTVSVEVSQEQSSGGGGGGGGGGRSNDDDDEDDEEEEEEEEEEDVVPDPSVPPSAGVGVRTTASMLNVRSSPNGTIIGKVPYGTTGTTDLNYPVTNGWTYVVFSTGVEGWVFNQYLVPIAGTPTPAGTVRVTATNLNVRSTPAGLILRTVPLGTVAIQGESANGWVRVTFSDGTSGWVSASYVTPTTAPVATPAPVPAPAPAPTLPTAPSLPVGTPVTVTASVLNVRSGPDGSVIGKVTSGTNGVTIGSSDSWTNVTFTSGTDGWVWTGYIRQGHTANAQPVVPQPAPVVPVPEPVVEAPAPSPRSYAGRTVIVTVPTLVIYEQLGTKAIGVVSRNTEGTVHTDTGGVWIRAEFSHGLIGYIERSGVALP